MKISGCDKLGCFIKLGMALTSFLLNWDWDVNKVGYIDETIFIWKEKKILVL